MRLSHLADYAVVLMTAAARRPAGARLSATELAGDTGVPLPTAQKLMGQLATCGLLTSARGASGGFALARPAQDISLADIVEAVEGPIAMTVCSGTSASLSNPAASPTGEGKSSPATRVFSEDGRLAARCAGIHFSAAMVARCAASASSANARGRISG